MKDNTIIGHVSCKNYVRCGISSNMMEMQPVKSLIDENLVKALKSLCISFHLYQQGWLSAMSSTIYVPNN